MKIINREHFGLGANPWNNGRPTADSTRVAALVAAAIQSQEFVSILGPRGSGKTWAVRAALADHTVKVVEPLRLTRDKLHMGDIETALVRELSDESPRRSGEARSYQVKRVLGEFSRAQAVVLVIDDAHVLHHQTLRALKRLREFTWLNRSPLLGIVLIGQHDKTRGIDEVRLRSDQMWLEGLTAKEIASAVRAVTGQLFEAAAVQAIADSGVAANWLDLQAIVDACLAAAKAQGLARIDARCVRGVLRPEAKSHVSVPRADDQAVADYLARPSKSARAA